MIPILDLKKDGKDVQIVLSKNLNFLLYIYRFYDLRKEELFEYQHLQVKDSGLMATAFFHLRGITLWNNIIYALSNAIQPAEADESGWYDDEYDFDALFNELDAYQALRAGFLTWWEETGEQNLVTMETQIKDALADFPFTNLEQDRFLILPVYAPCPTSLTWGNEHLVVMSPNDLIDLDKTLSHLTFMSKAAS